MSLSSTQLYVIRLLCAGHVQKEIASVIGTSDAAVAQRIRRIHSKLDIRNTAQMCAFAVSEGLVDAGDVRELCFNLRKETWWMSKMYAPFSKKILDNLGANSIAELPDDQLKQFSYRMEEIREGFESAASID